MILDGRSNHDEVLRPSQAAPLISAFVAHGARPRYLLLFLAAETGTKEDIAPRGSPDRLPLTTLAHPWSREGEILLAVFGSRPPTSGFHCSDSAVYKSRSCPRGFWKAFSRIWV